MLTNGRDFLDHLSNLQESDVIDMIQQHIENYNWLDDVNKYATGFHQDKVFHNNLMNLME